MSNLQLSFGRTVLALVVFSLLFAVSASIGASAQVTGAGSTFAYPIYSKWFDDYHKRHPNIQITYQPIGSGLGIRRAIEGAVDFGASDAPMNDEQVAEFREKRGANVLHFPSVLGADVACYNVPGIAIELNFTPEAIAGIFLGKITRWNDPELAKANPKVTLPNNEITVVHRSDGSGTTYIWADYLSKVSSEWKSKVGTGTSINWPVGQGAKGNDGVSTLIQETPYSIGYVELIYAKQHKLLYGRVRNSSGAFVKADLTSVKAAAAAVANNMPEDFRVSITNAPSPTAYPISSFTWLLIPDKFSDEKQRAVIVDFLRWMLSQGQASTTALFYAQLPREVSAKEMKAIARIQ